MEKGSPGKLQPSKQTNSTHPNVSLLSMERQEPYNLKNTRCKTAQFISTCFFLNIFYFSSLIYLYLIYVPVKGCFCWAVEVLSGF